MVFISIEFLFDHVQGQRHGDLLVVVGILIPLGEIEKGDGNLAAILVGGSLELLNELATDTGGCVCSLSVREIVVLRRSVSMIEMVKPWRCENFIEMGIKVDSMGLRSAGSGHAAANAMMQLVEPGA